MLFRSAALENDQRWIRVDGIPVRIEAAAPGSIDLSDIAAGIGGFVINGQGAYDRSGFSVASAGDVNGDGLADLFVGAREAGRQSGRSYVVFGKTNTLAVNLSTIAAGRGGFVIRGQAVADYSGGSVASAGDVNGDGLVDLIVGAAFSDPATGINAGRSYVVFGKTNTVAIDLTAVAAGRGGFVINGQGAADYCGGSVASAGDVNGDGLADLIVGAAAADPATGISAGCSYVVFGKTSTAAIQLSAVASGSGGFVIRGETSYDFSGASVAGAGDVNGDGLADLIVGTLRGDGGQGGSCSYVIFGKTQTTAVDLALLASTGSGFIIRSEAATTGSIGSVSGAGDLNGDGLADLLIGAYLAKAPAGDGAGASYVVFGKTNTAAVDLCDIAAGSGGFVINGQSTGDYSGRSEIGRAHV